MAHAWWHNILAQTLYLSTTYTHNPVLHFFSDISSSTAAAAAVATMPPLRADGISPPHLSLQGGLLHDPALPADRGGGSDLRADVARLGVGMPQGAEGPAAAAGGGGVWRAERARAGGHHGGV